MVNYYANKMAVYAQADGYTCWLGEASGTWYKVDALPQGAVQIARRDLEQYVAEMSDLDDYWRSVAEDVLAHIPSGQEDVAP